MDITTKPTDNFHLSHRFDVPVSVGLDKNELTTLISINYSRAIRN